MVSNSAGARSTQPSQPFTAYLGIPYHPCVFYVVRFHIATRHQVKSSARAFAQTTAMIYPNPDWLDQYRSCGYPPIESRASCPQPPGRDGLHFPRAWEQTNETLYALDYADLQETTRQLVNPLKTTHTNPYV